MNSVERPNNNFEQTIALAQSYVARAHKNNQKKPQAVNQASGNNLPKSGNHLPSKSKNASVSIEKLENVVETINNFMASTQRELSFSLESDLNQTIIKVVNTETDEVVRQIPSEEAIALAKALRSSSESYVLNEQGLIIETEA